MSKSDGRKMTSVMKKIKSKRFVFHISKYYILYGWDLNLGNPSIKFAMDCASEQGFRLYFLLQAICNHLQPERSGMVKNHIFSGFTPNVTEF